VHLRRWVLLFEGRVISPLTETVYIYIYIYIYVYIYIHTHTHTHTYPHISWIQKLVRLAIECGISQSTKHIDEYNLKYYVSQAPEF
jgi:hypothetical protein